MTRIYISTIQFKQTLLLLFGIYVVLKKAKEQFINVHYRL